MSVLNSSAHNVSFGDVDTVHTKVLFEDVRGGSKTLDSDLLVNPPLNISKPCSFLHWNVQGIVSKLSDADFISFVYNFDFVCLVETFVVKFEAPVSIKQYYKVYPVPAIKWSKRGRPSGGLVCLVKKTISSFVEPVDVKSDYFYAFIIDKKLLDTERDILYACVYVPPEKSPYYAVFDVENGIAMLEDFLCDCILAVNSDVFVILSGDFNSRTCNISCDFDVDMHLPENRLSSGPLKTIRKSEDTETNNYGKLMLNMCTALRLYILNGMCQGDLQGRYTFIGDSGSSVNDYFLMSYDLFVQILDNCKLCVPENIQSDHMPLTLYINISERNTSEKNNNTGMIEKFVWNEAYNDVFMKSIYSAESESNIKESIRLLDTDVNKALSMFNDCLTKAATCMKKQIYVSNKVKESDWYDIECREGKRRVRKLLNRYRHNLSGAAREAYCKARREYKHLLKRKEKMFNSALLTNLLKSINNQKEFWSNVNKTSFNRRQPVSNIESGKWFQHFKGILERNVGSNANFIQEGNSANNAPLDNAHTCLNRPISKEEIMFAVRKLKPRKASGPDGIIGEMLKNACESDVVFDFLVKMFNVLFDKGLYPDCWTESFVLPIHKKGDTSNPNNYRGISLCSVNSKLYSTVINRRLQEWVNERNLTGELQAGFKQNYSTIDHMFTLLAFVQKQFSLNRKLYIAFIDFEKAFDSVNRSILWHILLKNGIGGKLYNCILSMYDCVKARVRAGAALTDYINCTTGVKQGDVCSPILFSLFINELTNDVVNSGRHGATFINEFIEIFILLLADDVLLISETVIGLQTQLNSLQRSAASLQLNVNMSKSNIIVFRKGGYLAARERWTYNGIQLPVVNVYKYLGIYFSTRLSFTFACKDLASRAKNALFCIMKKLSQLSNESLSLFLKLFDAQVQPIMLYGAEIWGFNDVANVHCDKVHLFGLKKFLGVSLKTPNALVYGETSRYPLSLLAGIKCIRYWIKLIRMDPQRVPYKSYKMLVELDNRGKVNWVTNVKTKLFEYGFGFVWMNQCVADENWFIRNFRDRVIECWWQKWNSHIESSERFEFYSLFSQSNSLPTYMSLNIGRHMKRVITKFRFGITDICVHTYRYRHMHDRTLVCPLCQAPKEDEIHFVLVCPGLKDLREKYIPAKFLRQPCMFRLTLLFSSTNNSLIKQVAMYLYKAFERRSLYT